MREDHTPLHRTLPTLASRLLECRTPAGHWEGHLASSALSTATATVALMLAQRAGARNEAALIRLGLGWLIANQNRDGGWGDTVLSFSNLSTTVLCWSALSLGAGTHDQAQGAIDRAERWLHAHVGDLGPESLKNAIVERYGKDRTFSAPILTVLALTGKLGSSPGAWRLVPQLPFELAACPHRWFRWLRLPVVSYALPALVGIGQVRHHHSPTRNPLLAPVRSALRSRTLQVARAMQPDSGGYLEATPLTAFVVMSLIGSGYANDPNVARGLSFLIASARAEGRWAIDTNLATWVTTLSVDALTRGQQLSDNDRQRIVEWLRDQQVREEHSFTHARPGGWAWTDLTGGVPDSDDTAGAVLALWNLAGSTHLDAAVGGIEWLLELQNSDGGIPTFCRGWGALPFDRSAPDLTAHALEAWSCWYPAVASDLQRRISRASKRAVTYLARHQRPEGSWAPLWFGNQHVPGEINLTYGTARVLAALANPLVRDCPLAERSHRLGLGWLLRIHNPDGGWGGAGGTPSSIEETSLALRALAISMRPDTASELGDPIARAVRWLIAATEEGRRTPASPIGLYFARLWYYEELYPLAFAVGGLAQARAALTLTPR
jgi:squalene-hopene/tetraprenyl-beta-curcumene cyclase